MNNRSGVSIGKKLESDGFRPTGFDYMRITLAALVVINHAATIAQGEQAGIAFFTAPLAQPLKLILPAFFALSGFLVAGSMVRSKTLVMFLSLRGLRIYPALAVEVFLSAILIGPLVTNLPLGAYLTDPKFYRYLINVTGHISFYLPGVFVHAPKPDIVNYQLWTVPWELVCYLFLSAMILIGVKKNRLILLLTIPPMAIVCAGWVYFHDHGFLVLTGHVWGPDLVLFFTTGVGFFLYRDEIPWNWPVFLAATAIGCISMFALPGGQYIGLIPVVYMTVFLGTCNPRMIIPGGLADSSYGVYLYGYVIQQVVADQFPWTRTTLLNIVIALPLSIVAGLISWHVVEKPIMNSGRPKLKVIEARWIALRDRLTARRNSGRIGAP